MWRLANVDFSLNGATIEERCARCPEERVMTQKQLDRLAFEADAVVHDKAQGSFTPNYRQQRAVVLALWRPIRHA